MIPADADDTAQGGGADPSPQSSRISGLVWLDRVLIGIGAVVVFAMMFLSVTDALLRSFFSMPVFGAHDYSQVLLSFAVAASLPICVMAGRAIAIDTVIRRVPLPVRFWIGWAVSILGALILGYLAWRAFLNGMDAARFGETTMLLRLPLGPSYHALAVGTAIAAVLMLVVRPRHDR